LRHRSKEELSGKKRIREIIAGKWRIIYRIITKEVEILPVHHGAQGLLKRINFLIITIKK
jgi:plasmid stabilization system protein ParE